MPREFYIVVIGGGHAGAEAAHAAARLGARTALVTMGRATVAAMSCNPAIGGIGKGQIVREIDALGGLMGLAADATGIQFRMLNRSKGPAVWGPRCQSDRHAYAAWVQQALAATPGLTIIEGEAIEIVVESGDGGEGTSAEVRGVRVQSPDGEQLLPCRAAIITAGTFLRGVMHCGPRMWDGGRYDEPAANALSECLSRLGVRLGRLKTGTCPRIDATSIDYSRCTRQDGDAQPTPFSFLNDRIDVEQVPCWITFTNPATHQIIRDNRDRAPIFTGQIQAGGPRYCPSLETKIERFADRDSHQVFIEPEGRSTPWVYLNGVSTSLPPDVQEPILRTLPGLENCRVLRWGYAIEYDFADPVQLRATLETKRIGGLYLAGQVNGTTGYEEAAGQGLVAGVNAALRLAGREPMVPRRDQSYLGVMIDDLVTKGVLEPYRMFTSRAENRLALRAENADRRLTPLGRRAGLVDERRWAAFSAKLSAAEEIGRLLAAIRREGRNLADWLARPGVELEHLVQHGLAAESAGDYARLAALCHEQPLAAQTVAIDCRYAGYLAREKSAAAGQDDLDASAIPHDIDYAAVAHLRAEARERLSAVRPETIGQAMRVSGVTPADITILMIHLRK